MNFILDNWQFLVAVGGLIGGYFDLKSLAKYNREKILDSTERIATLETILSENEKKDAVIRSELDTIKAYKDESSRSKDEAMLTLAEIKGLLVGLKESLTEIKKDHHNLRDGFQKFKDKIRG